MCREPVSTAKQLVSSVGAIAIALTLCAAALGCGESTQGATSTQPDAQTPEAGAGPGGHATIFVGTLAAVITVVTYFAPYRDCEPLPSDEICRVRHATSCFPAILSPSSPIANAGVITVTDGVATVIATPDEFGLYDLVPARLDVSRPLKLVAAGSTVPPFETEILYPPGSLTLQTPAAMSTISRSAPLNATWSGSTSAEFAAISIENGEAASRKKVECSVPPAPGGFEIGKRFTAELEAGTSTRFWLGPMNKRKLMVGDWSIDVVAEGAASSSVVEVAP